MWPYGTRRANPSFTRTCSNSQRRLHCAWQADPTLTFPALQNRRGWSIFLSRNFERLTSLRLPKSSVPRFYHSIYLINGPTPPQPLSRLDAPTYRLEEWESCKREYPLPLSRVRHSRMRPDLVRDAVGDVETLPAIEIMTARQSHQWQHDTAVSLSREALGDPIDDIGYF